MNQQLSERDKGILKQLVSRNKKIEAIKYIRKLTGLGLKESKEISDSFFDMPAEIETFFYMPKTEDETFEQTTFKETIHEHKTQSHELSEKELNFVSMLLKGGQKLNAVKYVKDRLKSGLKEAKEFVDALEGENKTSETFIIGQDKNVIVELEIEDKPVIAFKENPTGLAEPFFEEDVNITEKKHIHKKKRTKKKRKTNSASESIVFGKSIERDKNKGKRRRQSNSGCMLMLTFMFVSGLLIVGGIIYL